MRSALLSLAFSFVLLFAASVRSGAAVAHDAAVSAPQTAAVYALQVPDKKIEITVGDHGGSVRWYRNPVWIAIGVIALIIVLLLIVLIARGGGGTTIVRE